MKKHILYGLLAVVSLILVLSMFTTPVLAATKSGLDVAVSGGDSSTFTDVSATEIKLIAKARGGFLSSSTKTTTFTITNNTGNQAEISFDLEGSGTPDSKLTASGNRYSILLNNGGSFTITASATGAAFYGVGTTEVILKNISIKQVFSSMEVTVQYDAARGKVTQGSATGTVVANGGKVASSVASPVTLVATPSGSYQFVAWVDSNNKVLSVTPSYVATPVAATMTVKAVFADNTPWFLANGEYLVEGLNEALAYINNNGTLTLANNATLPAGKHVIPKDVKLLIPFSASDTGMFGAIPENYAAMTENTDKAVYNTFRTLTVPADATLTVNGKINVNGQRRTEGQGVDGTGVPRGGHGLVDLQGEGEQLTIGSTGALYCYGFIKGTGTVKVNGVLHELMQVFDWMGGSNFSGWYFEPRSAEKINTLFFTAHYYIQNVEAPLQIPAGGEMFVELVITANNTQAAQSAQLLGKNTGLFQISDGTTLNRTYDPNTDRVCYYLTGNGTASIGEISITAQAPIIGAVTLSSSTYTMALNNSFTLRLGSGISGTVSNRMALMPGTELIVDEGATLNLTNHLYIMDIADKEGLFFTNQLAPLYTASRGTTVKMSVANSARLEINGDLNLSGNGGIYTTVGPKSTTTTSTDKVIYGTGKINHSGTVDAGKLQGGYDSTLHTLTIRNALLNLAGDGDMQSIGKGTYYGLGAEHGNKWYLNKTQVGGCETDGLMNYYCSDPAKVYSVPISATGHTPGAAATCTTAQTCTVCGIELDAAKGHTPGAAATCTTAQTCTVCGAELVAALGHTPGAAATCTTAQTCTVCGAELAAALNHSYKAVVTVPTCTTDGYTTHTCERCGDSYTDTPVTQLGHTPGAAATCTTAQTCTVCGAELVKALGHTPGAAATCTTAQNCTVCGAELVAALGHDWEVSYNFASDGSSCTATRVCKNDANHDETATATTITSAPDPDQPATFDKMGWTIYTAKFDVTWADEQTLKVQDIETQKITYSANKLSARGNVVLRMKFFIPEDLLEDETFRVIWTKPGQYTLDGEPESGVITAAELKATIANDDKGRCTVEVDLASGQMTCPVELVFMRGDAQLPIYDKDGTLIKETFARSILDFAMDVYTSLKSGNAAAEEDLELLKGMLFYGGYAQNYFNVDKDNPAAKFFTDEDIALFDLANYVDLAAGISEQVTIIGEATFFQGSITQSLILKSGTTMKTFFTLAEGIAISDLTFTVTDVNGAAVVHSVNEASGGRYSLNIEDIPAARWDDIYTITVTDGAGNTVTIKSTALGWALRCIHSDKAEQSQKDMAMAMFFYNNAANIRFEPKPEV